MQSDDEDQWISPSFNSYSQTKSAETAAKVAGDAQFSLPPISETDNFEFAFILNRQFDEQIITNLPVFNREETLNSIKVPLRRLFIEDQEAPSSSSSSSSEEADEIGDEIECLPPGSYCVWKPKVTAPSQSPRSKSTGFGSKRWKLRDLLRRSNSDGKDSFVFLTPKKKEEKNRISDAAKNLISKNKSTTKASSSSLGLPARGMIHSKPSSLGLSSGSGSPARKMIYSKASSSSLGLSSGLGSGSPTRRMIYTPANRDLMRGNETPNRSPKGNGEMPKRKSYLPYRQDLVGFFTTVNSLGRNFSSFKMK